MRYFEIRAETGTESAEPRAQIEGAHRWQLPNRIGCPDCTIYGVVGPAHPAVDLTGWAGEAELREPRSASWREFVRIRDRLATELAPPIPLRPGTEFGPFQGRVRGGVADLVIGNLQLLFVTPQGARRLEQAGVNLPPLVPARVKGAGKLPAEFFELDLPEAGELSLNSYTLRQAAACSTCGRWEQSLVQPLLSTSDIPADLDLLRPTNHATLLVASERFVDAVHQLELTGLTFREIRGV